ncbi:guanine deaminase [Pararhodobacter marinus]|uniref:Guanine deaminase n=1 Tax=Pararhodobacter marinus TaxID=2184063 RepID=A0A2U2CFX7_9RHOB|nr:amidohydrolase family protein [Pararhodobacter marinus]PWE30807.1 guanine deaminase [Pararhodobacter marinus]
MNLSGRTLVARGFHCPDGTLDPFAELAIEIGADGVITRVRRPGADGYAVPADAVRLPEGTLLLPGFVDLHIHAPQYPQLGTALDEPLEVWLQRYTFPLEARYADPAFAERVYARLVRDLLASGTTTALYFGTVHLPATQRLAELCLELGQRALVGKVAMDHPETCPDYYRDASADDAIEGTRALIAHIRALPGNDGRVQPVVMPRFIPACTDEALAGLGALAAETGCRVHTHVSESDWEHGHVLERHAMSDAESLARFGLMTPHSVLAHGNFLSDSDFALMKRHRAGVAHCPLSNAYFAGSVFPLRKALRSGVSVGLGSDISGGPAGTIWETARMAVTAARMLETGVDPALAPEARGGRPGARIDAVTAFHLATRGGAQTLGLPVGAFVPGMAFDAMLIDPSVEAGTLRAFDGETGIRLLERVLYGTSKPNIARVWVQGVQVAGMAR